MLPSCIPDISSTVNIPDISSTVNIPDISSTVNIYLVVYFQDGPDSARVSSCSVHFQQSFA